METADLERDSPAIRALGSLFKLTEVFLRNEGSKETPRRSSLPKHIRFKYDDDDEVNEDDSCDREIVSNVDGQARDDGDDDDGSIEEFTDLGQQMTALGLPFSFQTSKEKKNGTTKGKRKDIGIKTSFSLETIQDGVLHSANLSENESTFGEVAEVVCDELLITQIDEEGMETIVDGMDNEATASATKRKRKARKSKSRKKSRKTSQEQLFQCTVDSYSGGIGKYWWQRYHLFSKFDEGIKMDEEGWFSVTPECIARHQASRCRSGVIIDCFAGVGGNAIQFAKMGRRVIAIDICPKKIEYTKHNAAIYGVLDQMDFVIGDSISLASKLKADTVFLSPPWGGPGYSKLQTYDMDMLKPLSGKFLFDAFKETASMIVMFLPRNVNLNQVAELCLSADPQWSVEVEKNFLNDKFKAVTAYFSRVSLCNM